MLQHIAHCTELVALAIIAFTVVLLLCIQTLQELDVGLARMKYTVVYCLYRDAAARQFLAQVAKDRNALCNVVSQIVAHICGISVKHYIVKLPKCFYTI